MATDDLLERNLLKALGHPLRLRLLEAIIERGEQSPSALARRFDQPLATVSRHVRVLRDLGFVELIRTEPRRGAVEHFYRALRLAFIDDTEWERMPVALRRGLARQTFRKIFAEASAAGGLGGFDQPYAHLDRLPLELDDIGRREVSQALHELLRQAAAIQQRSDVRRSGFSGQGGGVRLTQLALLHFTAIETSDAQAALPLRRAHARPQFP
jgi:DNA-binding transcriptional ArsR family regulator